MYVIRHGFHNFMCDYKRFLFNQWWKWKKRQFIGCSNYCTAHIMHIEPPINWYSYITIIRNALNCHRNPSLQESGGNTTRKYGKMRPSYLVTGKLNVVASFVGPFQIEGNDFEGSIPLVEMQTWWTFLSTWTHADDRFSWSLLLQPGGATKETPVQSLLEPWRTWILRFLSWFGSKWCWLRFASAFPLSAVFCSAEQQSPEWLWLGLTWDNILPPGPVPPHWVHIATYALNSSVLFLSPFFLSLSLSPLFSPSSSSPSVDPASCLLSRSFHHSASLLLLFAICGLCRFVLMNSLLGSRVII